MRREILVALLTYLAALAAPGARADWPPSGLPLATGPSYQSVPVGLTAPGGDLLAFWRDAGSPTCALFAQRVTMYGMIATGWPDSGRGVVTLPAAVSGAVVTPDGAGGTLIAWYDYRSSGGPRGVYAKRVDAGGAGVSGWSASGTPVCTSTNAEGLGPLNDLVRMCADGEGGMFVAWTDARNTPPSSTLIYDVFAHHVLGDGSLDPAWPATGLAMTSGSGYKYPHALVADGAGGFWLSSEMSGATYRVEVSHHAGSGAVLGTWSTPSFASRPDAVSDGTGGVFLVWNDCRDCPGTMASMYVIRLAAGAIPAPGWNVSGVEAGATPNDDDLPSITRTSDGNAMIAWLAYGTGSIDDRYVARRVEAGGTLTPGWPATGRTFGTNDILSGWPLIASDGAGGAMFAFRRNLPNLYGSRVDAAGNVPAAFPPEGLSLCTLSGDQFIAALVPDGIEGAYVLWEDRRAGGFDSDVYAMRFTRDGVVGPTASVGPPGPPPALAMSVPQPNPAAGIATFTLALPSAAHARVEVLDVSGRIVAWIYDGDLPYGIKNLWWDGRDRDGTPVPPGVYVLRARAGAEQVSRRLVRVR